MNDTLEQLLRMLPDHPGVYIMKDENGTVIYVGKAISLKNRVRQYFQASKNHGPKVEAMVSHIATFDYILCDSEIEAFILECNMIKQHRPYYNIKLRDDKHYPYVRIHMGEAFPRVEITRKMHHDKARYFGPYFSTMDVRKAVDAIRMAFPIRTCKKDLSHPNPKDRPCLNYHIGKCMAPCAGKISSEDYKAIMRQVIRFLEGHEQDVIEEMRSDMLQASQAMQFEKAAMLRDRIAAIEKVASARQRAISTVREDWDVLGLYRDRGYAMIQLLVIRGGILIGSDHIQMDGTEDEEDGAVLRAFMQDYYAQQAYIPPLILLSSPPEEEKSLETWLTGERGTKVEIRLPERGEKRKLVDMAVRNARQALERAVLMQEHEWERTGGALQALAEILGLPKPPYRIEAYDISNIQGTNSVASMVVMEGGEPARDQYRRFRIQTVEGANDFASMAEVVQRRFRHAQEEREELSAQGKPLSSGKFTRMPDLVLIDGGPMQLAFAREVMDASGAVDIPAVGLAKREEEIYRVGEPDPIRLPKTHPSLHILQRIRDEAHRFAITYHRSLRGHKALQTWLDAVPGIGPARRKALLKTYVTRKAMEEASLEELAAVPGMNGKCAQVLYEHLHTPKENS